MLEVWYYRPNFGWEYQFPMNMIDAIDWFSSKQNFPDGVDWNEWKIVEDFDISRFVEDARAA